MRLPFLFLALLTITLTACGGDDDNGGDPAPTVNFDRQTMLRTWVEDVYQPSYVNFNREMLEFETLTRPSALSADSTLRMAFHDAYLAWQQLSPVLTGEAEALRLRVQANTYPTDVELIRANLLDESVNLDLPSNVAAQGLPAIEHLLYGTTADGTPYLSDDNPRRDEARDYLARLSQRLLSLSQQAAAEWTGSRAEAFIMNDGNSATASIDRAVNDFIFYYEKHLRAGKVGIPAGVFSDSPLADRVESVATPERSGEYFLAALAASHAFFAEYGLADYLDALEVRRDGELLSAQINNQFDVATGYAAGLTEDFTTLVETDNTKMLTLYDHLQRGVVLLKVDMLQALNINVDYVDADGD